jgi:DNA repair protein RecO
MRPSEFLRLKAIPLASFQARGTSKVIAFFSEETGQIRCAVKGFSKRNQTLPASIPLFSTYDLLVTLPSSGKDLYELREREVVISRNHLNQGQPIATWATASVLSEVLLRGTQLGDAHPYLFRMLDKALTCLENGAPPGLLLLAFLVKFLEHAGYGLRLEETVEGQAVPSRKDVLFDTASGGVFLLPDQTSISREAEPHFTGRCFRLDPATRKALLKIRLAIFDKLEETQAPETMVKRLIDLTHACLEHHLEFRLKSFDLFEQVIRREERPS